MKKSFLFLLVAITVIVANGCGTVIRVSNISEQKWVETNTKKGKKTHTVTTKVKGEVVGEVVTTDEWSEEENKKRPYQWKDQGYGYGYGRYGGYYR